VAAFLDLLDGLSLIQQREAEENRVEKTAAKKGRKADHQPSHPPVSNRQQHRLQSHHRSAL